MPTGINRTSTDERVATITARQAILVAFITAVASITATIISYFAAVSATRNTTADVVNVAATTAKSATQAAITQQQQRISGATISATGSILNRIGREFRVYLEPGGNVRIEFDKPFDKPPVALVAAHDNPNQSIVRILSSDERSLVITTNRPGDNHPVKLPFSFMVLESTSSLP